MAHAERWMLLGADAPFARPALALRGVLPVQARCLPGVLFGLRWALERRANDISHFMAAFVESRVIALARIGRIQRKEEHSSRRAKSLLNAWRMPSWPEAFGREYDQFASSLGDCVAAFFFAWAHESADARTSRPDAFCRRGERPPFARVGNELARTLERRYYRKIKERRIAVGEPFAPGKIDARYATEEAGVFMAKISARRVFFDVLPEGGELALLLDNPVMPRFFKDVRRSGAGAPLRRTRRVLRKAASAAQFPVCSSKRFRKLAHQYAERHRLFHILDFYQEVDVVGHNDEWRDFVEASPFKVKASDNGIEGFGDFIFNKAGRSDLGKRFRTLERFQGDHIKVRRFVIKTKKPSHALIIS